MRPPPGRYDDEGERYGAGRGGVFRGSFAGRGPRGYQRSDERIREDICERMCDSAELDASAIEILVLNGEVTLQGTVSDRYDRRLAEDLTERVSGVRDVNNQLRVTPGGSGQDDQLQQSRPGDPPRYRFWYFSGGFIGAKKTGRAMRPTGTSISTGRSIPTALRTRSPTSVGLAARIPTTP